MRTIVILSLIACCDFAQAQNVSKTIPVQPNQKIFMHFDFPELIKVSTWDKNEISIEGTVDINDGENNDAFVLDSKANGNTVEIKGFIKNMDELPKRMMVIRDNKKITFKSKEEYRKYVREHGKDINVYSDGSDINITLEIKVPKNMNTRVVSVYGMVEIKNFNGPLAVEATYGGVDVSVAEKSVGELLAETDYGQIYTSLDSKPTAREEGDFHTEILMKPGVGSRYSLESKYGNVYLRKISQ
jgi:hypothetical protein